MNRNLFSHAEAVVGCVPWFLPRLPSHHVCDPWEEREFTAHEEETDIDKECSHCLSDCEYTEYKVETKASEFRFSESHWMCRKKSNISPLQALRQL